MIEILEPNYDTPDYDICGNSPVYATLKINNITVPLCESCLEELRQELADYDKVIHCYQCTHFRRDQYDLKYPGSCDYLAKKDGVVLTKNNIGYEYAKNFSSTCKAAEKKK